MLTLAVSALIACLGPGSALAVHDLSISSSGKILVAGADPGQFTMAMLNPDGSLATGFGSGGTLVKPFGRAATLQPDGKVLVTGPRGAIAVLFRYRRDGSVDRNFSLPKSPGRVRMFNRPKSATLEGQGVLVRPNGKITLAAFYECFGADPGCGYTQDFFYLFRFTPKGRTIDYGSVYGGDVYGMSPAPGGKTLVVGTANEGDWTVVARFDRHAGRDEGFGGHGRDGWRTLDYTPEGVAAQSDGSAVIAMERGIARMTPKGIPDKFFGGGGVATCPAATPPPVPGSSLPYPWEAFDSVAVEPDDSLIGLGRGCGLVHLTQTGAIDTNFGTGGRAEVPTGEFYSADRVALQPDGKILVASLSADKSAFLVSRYLSDGKPDPLFGAGGMTSVPVGTVSRR